MCFINSDSVNTNVVVGTRGIYLDRIAKVVAACRLSSQRAAATLLKRYNWDEKYAILGLKRSIDKLVGLHKELTKTDATRLLEHRHCKFDLDCACMCLINQVHHFREVIDAPPSDVVRFLAKSNFNVEEAVSKQKRLIERTVEIILSVDNSLARYLCERTKWNFGGAKILRDQLTKEGLQVTYNNAGEARAPTSATVDGAGALDLPLLCSICANPITERRPLGDLNCRDATCREAHTDVCTHCVETIRSRRLPICPYCNRRL